MTDVLGSDVPKGSEVKWYAAGTAAGQESVTVSSGQASAKVVALAADAEYGSVVVTRNGTITAVDECSDASGTVPCVEGTAVKSIAFTALTTSDVLDIRYVAVTSALVQVAAAGNIKQDSKADVKKETIHGQANKIVAVGATEHSGDLEEFHYNQTFVALTLGDQIGTDRTGTKKKLTTAFQGVKKIGALVGKRYVNGVVTYKWFLIGVQFESVSKDFPKDNFYKRSMKFSCDYWSEAEV